MMKAPTETDRKIAAEMNFADAENAGTFFISFLGDVGANLQRDFPEYAEMLPRSFIWAGAAKIGRDFGSETAGAVLEQIAAMIRDGALDYQEAPDKPGGDPGSQMH
ncbi:MAG: hypothetical protein ACREV4_15565 [Gammaproteobacteria bacterium]